MIIMTELPSKPTVEAKINNQSELFKSLRLKNVHYHKINIPVLIDIRMTISIKIFL